MFNKEFMDTMDKINTIAKTMKYTNGIAWARSARGNKQLNEYDYKLFENCHNLRNFMAHGFSRDITVSAETLQIVKLFYEQIKQPQQTNALESTVLKKENSLGNKLFVNKGDFVVAMNSGRNAKVGRLFQVTEQNTAYDTLKDLSTGNSYSADKVYEVFNALYVTKEDLSSYIKPQCSYYTYKQPCCRQNDGKYIAEIEIKALYNQTPVIVKAECYCASEGCFKTSGNRAVLYDPDDPNNGRLPS